MKSAMKVYAIKYGMLWIAARGGATAKYRSHDLDGALKQFELNHPQEFERGDYKVVCKACGRPWTGVSLA